MRAVLSPRTPAGQLTPRPAGAQQPNRQHRAGARRWAVTLLALLGVLLLSVPAAGLVYRLTFAQRILPGVHALAIDLGGLTEEEARARLVPVIEHLIQNRPGLYLATVDGAEQKELTLPPGAFGEAEAMAARLAAAQRAGRETPVSTLTTALRAATGRGRALALPAPELQPLREAVGRIAPDVERPALEPQLVIDRSDPQAVGVRLEPGQAGRRLDVDRAAADLAAAFAGMARTTAEAGRQAERPVVAATVIEVPPATDAAQLEGIRQRLAIAFSRSLTMTIGGRTVPVDRPGQLVEGIDLTPGTGGAVEPRLALDPTAFEALIVRITATMPAPRNARLEVKGEQVVVTPEAAGETVDVEVVRQAVTVALLSGSGQVSVPVQPVPATVTAPQLAPYLTEADRLIAEPLAITRGEQRRTVGRGELATWLVLPGEPADGTTEGQAPGAIRLSDERIRATLQGMAKESDRQAKNARLEVQDGEVKAIPDEEGEALDVAATTTAVQAALRTPGGERTVTAAVRPAPAELPAAKLEPARAQAARLISGPITLRHTGQTWMLSKDDLAGMLIFGDSGGAGAAPSPYLSRNKLLEGLQPVADEVNGRLEQEFRQALKAWETRRAEQVAEGTEPAGEKPAQDPKPARQWVDLPATAGAVWAQASTDTRVADVRLTTTDPATMDATSGIDRSASAPGRGKWVDVNLTTQFLVAYEGDWPVLSSRVSAGLLRTPTPAGTYRVFTKLVADDMRGGSYATGDYYFLPKVPYVMYFLEGGYALHGTYWHNNFGHPMSHGCVNLPTDQAKVLFEWAPLGTTVVVHK